MTAHKSRAYNPSPYARKSGAGALSNNDYAILLLHCNGVSSPAVIVDDSPFGRTASIVGTPSIVATPSVFGSGALSFRGSAFTDSVGYGPAGLFDYNMTGDFTIDMRWRPNNAAVDSALITLNNNVVSTGADIAWGLRHMGATNAGKVQFYMYAGTALPVNMLSTTTLVANTWYAIRVTRKGDRFRLYINGIAEVTTSGVYSNPNFENPFVLRLAYYTAAVLYRANGYMDEIRILKGIALSDANYTLDTAEF